MFELQQERLRLIEEFNETNERNAIRDAERAEQEREEEAAEREREAAAQQAQLDFERERERIRESVREEERRVDDFTEAGQINVNRTQDQIDEAVANGSLDVALQLEQKRADIILANLQQLERREAAAERSAALAEANEEEQEIESRIDDIDDEPQQRENENQTVDFDGSDIDNLAREIRNLVEFLRGNDFRSSRDDEDFEETATESTDRQETDTGGGAVQQQPTPVAAGGAGDATGRVFILNILSLIHI